MANDPYAVLGVARDATVDDIKSAYRRLARQFHPDVNPGDPTAEEKFKEIGEAYGILSDPERKARFDRYGQTEDVPSGPGPGEGFGGGFGDLFDMFFGGGAGGRARRVTGRDGDDLQRKVTISLADVLSEQKRTLTVDRLATCGNCRGQGTADGAPPDVCGTCRGTGAVSAVRNTMIGQVRTSAPCPTCRAEGTVIKNPCSVCRGEKRVTETKEVPVTIPEGIESGSAMQIPGFGDDGVGQGRPGDLYVVVEVENDPRFVRDGTQLYTAVELTMTQAALGDEIEIEGVDGPVGIEVPAGTQPEHEFVVRGGGVPPLRGGRRGDLTVRAVVKIPERLSDAEARLLREFAELRGEGMPKGSERGGGLLGGLFGKKR